MDPWNQLAFLNCFFFLLNFEQNANASASKKASGSAGRSKLQPPAVDGVSVASLNETAWMILR